jgi:Fe-S cluster biogenesis protein NfuA
MIEKPVNQPADKGVDREKVVKALDEIATMLRADGGDLELVKIEGSKVHVRLVGACAGCPARQMTLKNGVERVLKQKVPEVKEVVAV